MKTLFVAAITFFCGMTVQKHSDNVFVASTFHSSTSNFDENVMQGAALLDLTTNDLKVCLDDRRTK